MTTATELKTLIDAFGGVDALIGISFDNSAAITFEPKQFSYSSNIDETLNVLKFVSYDSKGTPFIIIKPIETIQAVMFKDPSITDITIYDAVSIRS